MYIIVEAQNAYYKGYPIEMRGVYYAARRLSSQLKASIMRRPMDALRRYIRFGLPVSLIRQWKAEALDSPA